MGWGEGARLLQALSSRTRAMRATRVVTGISEAILSLNALYSARDTTNGATLRLRRVHQLLRLAATCSSTGANARTRLACR